MTPLQGEPAGESNRTLYQPTSFNMGLEKYSAGHFWGTNKKFWTPSVVRMAIGFHQKHLSPVSGITRTPEASDRLQACAVLSSTWNWRSNKGWVL